MRKCLSKNKSFLFWATSVGVLTATFALAPQIDLWIARGNEWKGIYAITDHDEPFYAAYLQSLMEGKPRRNSPYTGAIDNLETPQKESHLSIQFLASYPTAQIAKLFGFSLPTTMIFLSAAIGFLSAIVIFWLFYLFFQNTFASFVGTLIILFGGTLAAGQGSFFNTVFSQDVHYTNSLLFLRRTLPASGFPVLFLFFILIWKFIISDTDRRKVLWGFLSIGCFGFSVFSYFYFWTTAIAWFLGLIILWTIFRFEELRKNKFSLACLSLGLSLFLIPYFVLLQNRSADVDAALTLNQTHTPDLFRIPEIVSYLTIVFFLYSHNRGWINLREKNFLFLMSFTLVSIIVFNQQILTGYSLQPFHYQFFCANYIAVFPLFALVFHLAQKKLSAEGFHRTLLLAAAVIIIIGCIDTVSGMSPTKDLNIRRDELIPVTRRIKEISAGKSENSPSLILSFDFSDKNMVNGMDIPSLTSQPVVWSVYMSMFPDVNKNENKQRLFKFLYYQNFSEQKLRHELRNNNFYLIYTFFGADKTSDIYINKLDYVKHENVEEIVSQFGEFRRSFNYEEARTDEISFVLVHRFSEHDLSVVDRWYQIHNREDIGEYTLYTVELRDQ